MGLANRPHHAITREPLHDGLARSRRLTGGEAPLRVLHFVPWLSGGGVEVALRELIAGLPADRYAHRVVCIEARGPRRADFDRLGIPITVLGGRGSVRNLGALCRLARIALAWRPHILHAAVFEGQVFGTIAGRLTGVPVIVTEEATCPAPPAGRSKRTRVLLRQILSWNDQVIAIAPSVRDYLVDQNGLPPELVRTILYGIPRPKKPSGGELADERRALRIPADALVLGTVCRLHDVPKRVSDLILAVAMLRDALPTLHLLVVGDGPDRDALRERARVEGVADRVHFAGYRADPASCYYLMDIFAMASAFEGFGRSFVEAAACGLPCIGSAVGGIVDAIEHDVTGLLTPPFDPTALAAAVRRLALDADLRHRMGEAGMARAERLHSVEQYARAFDDLFQTLVQRKRRRARSAPDWRRRHIFPRDDASVGAIETPHSGK